MQRGCLRKVWSGVVGISASIVLAFAAIGYATSADALAPSDKEVAATALSEKRRDLAAAVAAFASDSFEVAQAEAELAGALFKSGTARDKAEAASLIAHAGPILGINLPLGDKRAQNAARLVFDLHLSKVIKKEDLDDNYWRQLPQLRVPTLSEMEIISNSNDLIIDVIRDRKPLSDLEKVLATAHSTFGPNHLVTAELLTRVGERHQSYGNFPSAVMHTKQALDIYKRLGQLDANWNRLPVSLAQLLLAKGQEDDAKAEIRSYVEGGVSIEQARAAYATLVNETVKPYEGEPPVRASIRDLVEQLRRSTRITARVPASDNTYFAVAQESSTQEGAWSVFPVDYTDAEIALSSETIALYGQSEGRARSQKLIELHRKQLEFILARRDVRGAANIFAVLARELGALGEHDAARGAIDKHLETTRIATLLTGYDPASATPAALQYLQSLGQPALNEQYFSELIAIRTLWLGGEGEQITDYLIRMGDALRLQEKSVEAREAYERAKAILLRLLGPDYSQTRMAVDRIDLLDRQAPLPLSASLLTEKVAKGLSAQPTPDASPEMKEEDGKIYSDLFLAMSAADQQGDWPKSLNIANELLAFQASRGIVESLSFEFRGRALTRLERFSEAESALRQALSIEERAQGNRLSSMNEILLLLAEVYMQQGRFAAAEQIFRRVLALGTGNKADVLAALATSIEEQNRPADAEPIRRSQIGRDAQASYRDQLIEVAALIGNLVKQGRKVEARALLDNPGFRSGWSFAAQLEFAAARNPEEGGRAAEPLVELLLDVDRPQAALRLANIVQMKAGEQSSPTLLRISALKGESRLAVNDPFGAVADLNVTCFQLFKAGRRTGSDASEERRSARLRSRCGSSLARALWQTRENSSSSNLAKGFEAAQLAALSEAGVALSRSSARQAAASLGADASVAQYEKALSARRRLDETYADIIASAAGSSATARQEMDAMRVELDKQIDQSIEQIGSTFPAYWDIRSPAPVTLDELQGPDSLLKTGEAIVTFFIPRAASKGLVFAVSSQSAAWAEISISGGELEHLITTLRRQIDPRAYGVGGSGHYIENFDRRAAHQLHNALIGDRGIQAILMEAKTLIFVPSGPLTSFPPGILVTTPPQGADDDPNALRSTPWLLRQKPISILPTVSALRTLRARQRAGPVDSRELLVFADPDFAGPEKSAPSLQKHSVGAVRGYYRDGEVDQSALAALPRLPGTRKEGLSLARLFNANRNSVYLDSSASEAQIRRLNKDGHLSKAGVISFATHGLIAGDLGLAEPALALAHPSFADNEDQTDGLLTAGEVAALDLNADWVLLSACNTASPESAGAGGLSGLTRAFFFAGARSILVSHWRVEDEAGAAIVTGIFAPGNRGKSKAEALQQATLAVLDDRSMADGADPAAWAPYVLVGTPD